VEIPRLETERLILRGFTEEDVAAMQQVHAEEEVTRYLGTEPFTLDDAWRFVALMLGHWELRGFGMFVVEAKDGTGVVGRIGPWQPAEWPGFELGYALGREHWGHGYAKEAVEACLVFSREVLGQERVVSCIDPANANSQRVARALGAQISGQALLRGRHPVDVWEYP
jgi:RimJ/RimL family protein N-acetyltransferase